MTDASGGKERKAGERPGGRCESRREPLSVYLANRDHVSSSQLRRFARLGLLAADQPNGGVVEGSIMGEALHALVLEPETFELQYLVLDGSVPSQKSLSEEDAMRRQWLDAWQWGVLHKARDALFACTQAPVADWLGRGERELSIYWTDERADKWKARPDCFTPDIVLDLKSTVDCRPEPFRRTRERLDYDLQAAHYVEAVSRLTGHASRFAFLTVELSSPYAVWVHELDKDELAAAQSRLAQIKADYSARAASVSR